MVNVRDALAGAGLLRKETFVATEAALAGAKIILDVHGASPQKLQIVFKAREADTPRTIVDLRSGEEMRRIVRLAFPNITIYEEESGKHAGTEGLCYVDPLDGTIGYGAGQRLSTNGLLIIQGGEAVCSVICRPFEGELVVAEEGRGTFLFPLGEHWVAPIGSDPFMADRLGFRGEPRKLELKSPQRLKGGIVFVDALFNAQTTTRKLAFMQRLVELSGNNLSFRLVGSNMDQQAQVAAGRGQLTFTDAVGGFWDIAAGALSLKLTGRKMVDCRTWEAVTPKTHASLAGPEELLDIVRPYAQELYHDYTGFR